jgi:drug/metabolite transporter (DMT)-like permease
MEKKNNLRQVLTMILFGAIWGLLEATVGYLLHWLPSMVTGFVMFPIGAALMMWGFRSTDERKAILVAGLVAAAIKVVNFALPLPGNDIMRVLNPMISIILQSIIVFGFSFLFERKTTPMKATFVQLGVIVAAIVGWRMLFLVNQAVNYAITGVLAAQIQSFANAIDFVFMKGAYELLILVFFYGLYRLGKFVLWKQPIRLTSPDWLIYILSPLTLAGAVFAVVLL